MSTVTHRPVRGYRTIRLPIAETDYARFVTEGEFARAQLARLQGLHPELFPDEWEQRYVFYGLTAPSRKQHLRFRRVRFKASGEVFSIVPAFMMPYLSAPVKEVEKALFLMRFHVPCWAIRAGCDVLVSLAVGTRTDESSRHDG